MTERPRPFRYHAVDLDREVVLGTYASQPEATFAVLQEGESADMAVGERRHYAVRVESKVSGETYDIRLEVAALSGGSG
jgi:hypothetical protein